MRLEKKLGIGLVFLLLLSMAMVVSSTPWDGTPDDPTPAQAIWVDPKNTTGLDMGDTFVVDVLINITDPPGAGTGLFGFEYKLFWNSTVLDVVEIQTHSDNIPSNDLLQGWTSIYIGANVTGVWSGGPKDGLDYHLYAVMATGGVAFTGVDSLCTYRFRVLWQPTGPGAVQYCGLLDIQDETLVDETATPIDPHTTEDGMYCLEPIPPKPPKIGLSPAYVLGICGENITVDVVIECSDPLFPDWNLCCWEAKLSYNNTVLEALQCIEGAWFAGFAGPNGTYPICNINHTAGVVHMADLYLGNHTTPSGCGVLMTIVLNCISQYTVPPGIPPHLFPLDLFDVLLVDCSSQPIDLKGVNDGVYEEPYLLCCHDVAITNVTPSKTVVGQGHSTSINVTVQNQGAFAETFNVTVFYDTTPIETQTVSLAEGNSTILTFVWDTIGIAKGNYTITAEATPVPKETDTVDNSYTDGTVRVAMVGDVNADGIVNIIDLVYMAVRFGAKIGEPEYRPNADINDDGIIDITDIVIAAIHFGEKDC